MLPLSGYKEKVIVSFALGSCLLCSAIAFRPASMKGPVLH